MRYCNRSVDTTTEADIIERVDNFRENKNVDDAILRNWPGPD